MANQRWLDAYPNAEALFLKEGIYDHSPGILSLFPKWKCGKKPFKYFRMWKSHPEYDGRVTAVWKQQINGTSMYQIVQRLKILKNVFQEINQKGFSDLLAALTQAKLSLDEAQNKLHADPLNEELQSQELVARNSFILAQQHYSSFLQQKAKVSWLKDEDSNTALFHASIKQRHRQNQVFSIENESGVRVFEPEHVTEAFLSYYKSLLGTKMASRKTVYKKILNRGPKVTPEQAKLLTSPVTKEDVKKVVFEISGNKAPAPDGFFSFFFHDNWELVGEDVYRAVSSFLSSGKILKEINSTILTMIATKILCSRLKWILPDLISKSQGGFIQGRFIGHNIMICQDLVRHYGRKSNKENCMIKLDLQKAYDTVEWEFIEEMLIGLQFPSLFIKTVMNCVRSPRFSIMFNGSTHGFFEAKRGLRQGDPMSPLLFVLGMEYLSRILQEVGDKNDFIFHERCSELKVNHLAFADDVMLFCNGDFKSIFYLLQGLKLFSLTSGLQPNPQKSAIYCSNVPQEEVSRVLLASGFSLKDMPFTYLGVPICAKRISGNECIALAEKMTARIRTWSSRNLSFAARVVLINSVLMAIHAYWCQVFILPKKVIRHLESICKAFLWKGQACATGPGLIAWESLCQSKATRGQPLVEMDQQCLSKRSRMVELQGPCLGKLVLEESCELKGSFQGVGWARDMYTAAALPAIQGRLRTNDRLRRMGMNIEEQCELCSTQNENAGHLFFACSVSAACLQGIKNSLSWHVAADNISTLTRWIGRSKISRFKKNFFAAALVCLIYNLWKARNLSLWEKTKVNVEKLIDGVKKEVINRATAVWPKNVSIEDTNWFQHL
uniref:Reverse transcriptase domain-containing protein n=1 Tax=Cannabis sativa TaxID=3483 RepID=A0A803QAN8_CANSA